MNSELLLAGLLTAITGGVSLAQSNVQPTQSLAWGANVGWTNWRPDATVGAQIAEFVCSGYVYAANIGWIHLGNGRPVNGLQYQNDSAADYGVNHDQLGNLRGFAYVPNAGWIQFEEKGEPKVDLNTGKLAGFIYGANIGWMSLDGLSITSLAPGADSDADGIADAWEVKRAGNLTLLGQNTDSDSDGTADVEEYLADTNPLDAADSLQITHFAISGLNSTLAWPTKPTRHYVIQTRLAFSAEERWATVAGEPKQGTGQTVRAEIFNSAEQGQRYLRIQALRPLSGTPASGF